MNAPAAPPAMRKKSPCPTADDMDMIRAALHEQGTLIAALLTSITKLTQQVEQLTAQIDELIVIGHS